MGRPRKTKPKAGQPIHLSFVIDGALCKELDQQADSLTATFGVGVTRTEVIRLALKQWLSTRAAHAT